MNYKEKIKYEFDALNVQINELNRQMQETSKELMKEAFREFFEKYKNIVETVFWTQYTPYFNDGEACDFYVNDICYTLIGDENADDYEGSSLYSKSDINILEKDIANYIAWQENPVEYVQRYREEYIASSGYDPFRASYDNRSPERRMKEFKPSHLPLEVLIEERDFAAKVVSQYPDLKNDFEELVNSISTIDESIMKAMFGDHVKVIVSVSGIDVEVYDHE